MYSPQSTAGSGDRDCLQFSTLQVVHKVHYRSQCRELGPVLAVPCIYTLGRPQVTLYTEPQSGARLSQEMTISCLIIANNDSGRGLLHSLRHEHDLTPRRVELDWLRDSGGGEMAERQAAGWGAGRSGGRGRRACKHAARWRQVTLYDYIS